MTELEKEEIRNSADSCNIYLGDPWRGDFLEDSKDFDLDEAFNCDEEVKNQYLDELYKKIPHVSREEIREEFENFY
jgi:hypothetical protein